MMAHPDPKAATKSMALIRGSQGKVLGTQVPDYQALPEPAFPKHHLHRVLTRQVLSHPTEEESEA